MAAIGSPSATDASHAKATDPYAELPTPVTVSVRTPRPSELFAYSKNSLILRKGLHTYGARLLSTTITEPLGLDCAVRSSAARGCAGEPELTGVSVFIAIPLAKRAEVSTPTS